MASHIRPALLPAAVRLEKAREQAEKDSFHSVETFVASNCISATCCIRKTFLPSYPLVEQASDFAIGFFCGMSTLSALNILTSDRIRAMLDQNDSDKRD